jgi:hypothetical protein
MNIEWANDAILANMLAGKIDATGTFRPNDSIKRGEFAKMLVTIAAANNTLGNAITDYAPYDATKLYGSTFTDLQAGEYYVNYVGYLENLGVVQGDGNGKFRPNDTITRQEAAIMLSTLLNGGVNQDTINMVDVDGDGEDDTHTRIAADTITQLKAAKIADAAKINDWADDSVYSLVMEWKAAGKSVIGGDGANFNPHNNITRAEAIVMMQRAANATTANATK